MTANNFAVVTGGSTGIGAEICRQMLEAGYEVISLARRKPEQSHARLHAVEVDLMDRSATERTAADIAARFSDFAHRAQRRSHPIGAVARCRAGRLAGAHAIASRRRAHARAGRVAGDEAKSLRPHCAYVIARCARPADAFGLFCDQGWKDWDGTDLGTGARARRHQCGCTRADCRHRDVSQHRSEGQRAREGACGGHSGEAAGRSADVARAVMFFCDRANGFVTGQTLYVCGGASVGMLAI